MSASAAPPRIPVSACIVTPNEADRLVRGLRLAYLAAHYVWLEYAELWVASRT